MAGVFDIVKAIRSKQNVYEWDAISKEYTPFIVNKALSFDMQSIMLANEMNKTHINPEWAYQFYVGAVTRTTKFSPWIKQAKPIPEATLKAVAEYYQCSIPKAIDACKVLNENQLEVILNKGGKN